MGSYSRGILSPLRLPFRHVREADSDEARGSGPLAEARAPSTSTESARVFLEHHSAKRKPVSGTYGVCFLFCDTCCFFFSGGAGVAGRTPAHGSVAAV